MEKNISKKDSIHSLFLFTFRKFVLTELTPNLQCSMGGPSDSIDRVPCDNMHDDVTQALQLDRCRTGPIARLRVVWLQNPCGDKMRVFSRVCAPLPGWFPRTFLAQTRFLEVYATTFSAHVAGICPHIAGQLMSTRGTQRAQKNRAPRAGRRGMTLRGDKTRVFW